MKYKPLLSRSSKVKSHSAKINGIYELLLAFNSNCGSVLNGKETTGHHNYSDLDLTFQGHSRSKATVPKERPYMDYYYHSIVTGGLLCTIRELQAIQVTLTFI